MDDIFREILIYENDI